MVKSDNILDKVAAHVTAILNSELDGSYVYHNLKHTLYVVNSAQEIMADMPIDAQSKELVLVAAWFHDVGYVSMIQEHEKQSCLMAVNYLTKANYGSENIDTICKLIMATERYYVPTTELEKIIRDADWSHLGKKNYPELAELLKVEIKSTTAKDLSETEWRNANINLFRNEHRFYTDYAQKNWQERKNKNLRRLIKKKKADKKLVRKEKLKAALKSESPDRGIQTLYRVTLRNHIKLSDIADTKANILLSVNAIIISLVLSNLIPKLDNPSNDYLIYPTLIFVIFSIVSMVLSISATRPNITSGEFDMKDVKAKKVNLLFFGNFHMMALKDYQFAIKDMLGDKDYIYESLTKDLYFLGVVLARKYKILRVTYTIFMIGMITSVIVFFVAFKYLGPERLLVVPELIK
ncbi:HD domain-containing protein [Aurantibacter crassamenti]|uniref:Pycsar system effector family protein n=1 Tax=Aurantibacter crassamenti TaxID=1837375 RepID=UPI00193A267E|nr:Pycsar system effector family protein [Aurantibacter crassamenti]MBM1104580.1 HD domain-containing protein [Aurantibacter crassamenti]